MRIDTAVLPIAGLGTRFFPLSRVIPKELFPLGSKPVIQYIVEEAIGAGIRKIIFVISPEKKEIFEKYILKYFREDKDLLKILKERRRKKAIKALNSVPNIKYKYTVQKRPLGDGDAILKTEKLIGRKPFLVLFGDDVSYGEKGMATQLLEVFDKTKRPLTCLYRMPRKDLSSFGVPRVKKIKDRLYEIRDLIEKPKKNPPSSFALVGKYVLTPEIFFYLRQTKFQNGEIILANAIRKMIKDSKTVFGLEIKGRWLRCGTKERWTESFLFLANKVQRKSA